MPSPTVMVVVVVLAALFFMLLGVLYTLRNRPTLEGYITARNSVGAGINTATLVATAFGAWILFSPAETAATFGVVALAGYAVGSAAPFVALLWVGARLRQLMPEGHSITEYTWHRFGGAMYALVLVVMVFYMLIFLAAELTGIAVAVNLMAGTPLAVTIVVLGVATLAYTAYGGLRATIFTDAVQFVFIVGLLALALVVGQAGLGGLGPVLERANASMPDLLSLGYGAGWQEAVGLIIAILAANLFNQAYWQRVWAARDRAALARALWLSALLAGLIVFGAGLFGLLAVGAGIVEHPSTAFFAVVKEAMPGWAALGVLVLAVALVMSSVDSLLNGLVSSFTADLRRFRPRIEVAQLLRWAQVATIVIAVVAMAVATQAYSVLYLFLLADLVAAAVLVPTFLGLYVRRYGGGAATASSLLGLVAGALFFPQPDFSAWLPIPLAGNLMVSFLAAVLVSSLAAGVAVALNAGRAGAGYDLGRLQDLARAIRD